VTIKGFIRHAELREDPADADRVQLIASVQGVGPGQPRKILIPFEILVTHDELDADHMAGRAFRAEFETVDNGAGVVTAIEVGPSRVLREGD